MNIKLSEHSQIKRRLPTFNDIPDFEVFAIPHIKHVDLFLKLPPTTSEQAEESIGKAYCFRTGRVVDFHPELEEKYRKVKSVTVETGDEILPKETLDEG